MTVATVSLSDGGKSEWSSSSPRRWSWSPRRWRWSLVTGVASRGRSVGGIADEITRVLDAVGDRIAPTRLGIDIARRAVGRIGSAVVRS